MKTISKTLTLSALLLATLVLGCKKEDEDAISPDKLQQGVMYVTLDDGETIVGVVDLGLSKSSTRKLWATCNIGSSVPEGLGSTFAWAETTPNKREYDRDSYQWFYNGENTAISKYCQVAAVAHNGTDTLKALTPQDDPASVIYGEKWKTPSQREFQELLKHCTRTWGTVNGVWGCMLTSTENGNSIFFPLTGVIDTDIRKNTSVRYTSIGFYWTRDLHTTNPCEAKAVWVKDDGDFSDIGFVDTDRERGLKVRPIISRADAGVK